MESNDKVCRNCGSEELFSQEVNATSEGMDLLPLGFFSRPKFRIRVCADCGLIEWFVPSEYLDKVKEKFSREE